jgi:hypothetical protein
MISEPVADPGTRAPHPMSVMTGGLAIPIVSVNRDQLEEKRMGGSSSRRTARGVGAGNRRVIDIAAHGGRML